MTETRFLVDSSVWLAYFLGQNEKASTLIDADDNLLYTSVICLHEVSRKLSRLGNTTSQIRKALSFISENSLVIPVDDAIAEKSVSHCLKSGLHTIDALIYETAQQNDCILATADNDFKKLDNVELL